MELVEPETTLGFLMTRLDDAVRAWNVLKQSGHGEEDARKLRSLESFLENQVRLHLSDMIAQLEAGPPKNRAVAAVALGFSGLEETQSPLLSALEDGSSLVVGNALLGLGILAMPDTPLSQICYSLRNDSDPAIRRNAAYALQRIVEAGGRDECAVESARTGIADGEPSIRVMAAITLGLLADGESIPRLGDLLHDEEDFVCLAAATALVRIGRDNEVNTGEAARLLVAALDRERSQRRRMIHRELARLRGANLGDSVEPWREWAYKIP